MSFLHAHPWLIILLASELFLVITRSREITILVKKPTQRTEEEQKNVERGLFRSILLELLLFVPASVVLVLLLLPLARNKFVSFFTSPGSWMAAYSLVGLISYGFPFAAVRQIVTRVALHTLQEFANLGKYSASSSAPASISKPRKGGHR